MADDAVLRCQDPTDRSVGGAARAVFDNRRRSRSDLFGGLLGYRLVEQLLLFLQLALPSLVLLPARGEHCLYLPTNLLALEVVESEGLWHLDHRQLRDG